MRCKARRFYQNSEKIYNDIFYRPEKTKIENAGVKVCVEKKL